MEGKSQHLGVGRGGRCGKSNITLLKYFLLALNEMLTRQRFLLGNKSLNAIVLLNIYLIEKGNEVGTTLYETNAVPGVKNETLTTLCNPRLS